MKRKVRISEHKDYVAVDLVDDKNAIQSTPFYLTPKEPVTIMSKDKDERRWVKTKIRLLPTGEMLATDVDPSSNWEGLVWEITGMELEDPSQTKF